MPIRHCQKCGLKVLIDESQAGANPFYCQRCTTAMKGSSGVAPDDDLLAAAAAPVPAPAAKRMSDPALAAVAAAPAKAATVKVLCPYCKASFNGRVPQKPARGSCPVCQKELILLPDGGIRPAAGFDLAKWQAEGSAPAAAGAAKESGTKLLVKKYAAEPAPAAGRAESGTKVLARKPVEAPPPPPPPPPEPIAPPEETATDESAPLPSWLDEPAEEKKATAPPPPVEAPEPEPEPAPVRLEDLPPADEEPPPPPAKFPPPAVPAPPPAKPSAATARKAAASAGRRVTERRAVPAGAPAPTGAGKFMFALLLVALPVLACGVLLGVKEKLRGTVVEKLGVRFAKGFKELDLRLNPPPPKVAPKIEAPKPEPKPEEPAKTGPEDQARDENEILEVWNAWRFAKQKINQLSVGATDAQKVEIEKAQAEQKEREAKMDRLVERYRKIYGKEYDPRKQ